MEKLDSMDLSIYMHVHENYLDHQEAENLALQSQRYLKGDEIRRVIQQFAHPQVRCTPLSTQYTYVVAEVFAIFKDLIKPHTFALKVFIMAHQTSLYFRDQHFQLEKVQLEWILPFRT